MGKKKKEKSWLRFRHRVVRDLAFLVLYPYSRLRYGIRTEPFREQGDRAYLILMNHQTVFDQFFVGMSVKGPVYYVATEDIFSLGWVSDLIRWLVAPIPIKKQTTDISAVMTCLRIAREGGTIALAPEGNRTYSGKTEYMNPAIAKLAKKLKLPVALYRIEGGYGVQPRWTDKLRRGRMTGRVARVIEPEEYSSMTDAQLMEAIREGLCVNEACISGSFTGSRRAEYLERAIYVCPECGFSKFESHGNEIRCTSCGRAATYGVDKTLTGGFPFRFVGDWYGYQQRFVNAYDPLAHVEEPIFRDTADLSQVIVYERKELLARDVPMALYGDRMTAGDRVFRFDDITAAACLGRNKLNIYHGGQVYQLKGDKRFNALKYVNLYFRYRNVTRDGGDGDFLGL